MTTGIDADILFHLRRARALVHRIAGSVHARGWRATFARATRRQAGPPDVAHARERVAPRDRGDRPLLVAIDAETPRCDRDSGSVRLFQLLRLLVADGWHVAFIADAARDPEGERALADAGVEIVTGNPREWIAGNADAIRAAIVSRHLVAGHWLPYLRARAPRARLVFDTVDLHHVRESREAEHAGRPALARHARRTLRRERDLARSADATWVVSDVERHALLESLPGARVDVLSNIVPAVRPGPPFEARSGLLFVGGHRHPPNTDACWWMVRDLFPRIRARLPGIELHLVGPDAPGDLVVAARAVEGVRVHGHVPDLAPWLDGCRLAFVPLRFGAGVKGKVNASMAHGQPVVTTPCGAEGMDLEDGRDALVAADAEGLVDAVVRAYDDRALWERLAGNALRLVETRFSTDAALATARRTLRDGA